MSIVDQITVLMVAAFIAVIAITRLSLWLVEKLGGDTGFEEDDNDYWA